MCLHFDHIRPWHRCLKHTFFGLYIHVKFLKTVFVAFNRKMTSFFRFSLKLRSFLSLCFFRFSIMCRRVFNKTIILLGLAGYEMIITNSALHASLVIYHFLLYGKLRERAVCGEFSVLIGYPSGQDGAILPARDCPFRSRK